MKKKITIVRRGLKGPWKEEIEARKIDGTAHLFEHPTVFNPQPDKVCVTDEVTGFLVWIGKVPSGLNLHSRNLVIRAYIRDFLRYTETWLRLLLDKNREVSLSESEKTKANLVRGLLDREKWAFK